MAAPGYRLDDQVGFLLRRAHQRHTALFHQKMPERLTPTQFAAMARLQERGPLSQNRLGRAIALDAATIKGVVDRLVGRGLLRVEPDPDDGRRSLVSLTAEGEQTARRCSQLAVEISAETLAPVPAEEREQLLALLADLAGGPEV
jgi:DNA-binding MarR family transcriptional regulator